MSQDQETQLAAHFQRVVMPDGDEAGRRATDEIASRLAQKLWVRVVKAPDDSQLDRLSLPELQQLLQGL